MKVRINDFIDRDRKPRKPTYTPRDWRILEHIWEFDGALADYQIKALEFADNADLQQTKNRMALLFHNGYVHRLNRKGWTLYGCNVYWLTKSGAEVVAGRKGEDFNTFTYLREPRWSQLEHDMLTNNFTLILLDSVNQEPELSLYQWYSESYFRRNPDTVEYRLQGETKPSQRKMIPDRFFYIIRDNGGREKSFHSRMLLELDHGTHPNKRFADEKIIPGIAYIKSNSYLERFGSNSGRWLVVTTSLERLRYLKATTEQAAGDNASIWHFTTFEQVTADTLLTKPIWVKGGSEEWVALFPPRQVGWLG